MIYLFLIQIIIHLGGLICLVDKCCHDLILKKGKTVINKVYIPILLDHWTNGKILVDLRISTLHQVRKPAGP